jgi:hypothetical protein
MGQSQPQVFSGIAPEQFATLGVKAAAAGIAITGNTGSASKYGVEVSWNYAPEARQLTLQVLKTPFFINTADIESRLHALVQESLA